MIHFPQNMVDEVSCFSLLASTPGFLFRHLVQTDAVQQASSHSLPDIKETLDWIAGHWGISPEYEVMFYVYLIAFCLNGGDAKEYENQLNGLFSKKDWAGRINEYTAEHKKNITRSPIGS